MVSSVSFSDIISTHNTRESILQIWVKDAMSSSCVQLLVIRKTVRGGCNILRKIDDSEESSESALEASRLTVGQAAPLTITLLAIL